MFLSEAEIQLLTGRKIKSLQIKQLKKMALPFYVNACGHPVITRAAVEGRSKEAPANDSWKPNVLVA